MHGRPFRLSLPAQLEQHATSPARRQRAYLSNMRTYCDQQPFEANIAIDGGAGNCRGLILVNQTCSQLTMYGCAIRRTWPCRAASRRRHAFRTPRAFLPLRTASFQKTSCQTRLRRQRRPPMRAFSATTWQARRADSRTLSTARSSAMWQYRCRALAWRPSAMSAHMDVMSALPTV